MWRRYGDVLYAGILLVVFAAEAGALGALAWAFLHGLQADLPAASLEVLVLGALTITALALLLVSVFILAYHSLSDRWERMRRASHEAWIDRWVGVILQGRPAPRGRLSGTATEALLDLGEILSGQERDEVERLATRYGVGEHLLGKVLRRHRGPRWGRWGRWGSWHHLRPPSTRRLARRLEALEALAKARLPTAFGPLLDLLDHADGRIRLMALRAAARTISRLPAEADRHRAARDLVDRLRVVRLPSGAIEECLLLVDEAAPVVLEHALRDPPAPAGLHAGAWSADRRGYRGPTRRSAQARSLLQAALEAAGRLKALGLADDIAALVAHPEPEVRAAAIRALRQIGYVPPEAEEGVLAALHDELPFLRTQAAHVSPLLPRDEVLPELWRLMGDGSWWVRRAAAQALSRMAGTGLSQLRRAARRHPDRYARHMAVQVLLEAGRLDAEEARHLRAAG